MYIAVLVTGLRVPGDPLSPHLGRPLHCHNGEERYDNVACSSTVYPRKLTQSSQASGTFEGWENSSPCPRPGQRCRAE